MSLALSRNLQLSDMLTDLLPLLEKEEGKAKNHLNLTVTSRLKTLLSTTFENAADFCYVSLAY